MASTNTKNIFAVLFLSLSVALACDHGSERVIIKSYSNVEDYKATFVETAAPSFNSDLSSYAKIVFMTEGHVPEICKNTFNLDDLEVLQMNYMGVMNIEKGSFDNLEKLRVINLKANNLTSIDHGIFSKLPISYLMLTSNKIEEIHDDAFDYMPKLEILSLEDNKISSINPNWFKWSKNIRILSLENNLITEVPKRAFIQLNSSAQSPMKLYLNFNRIEVIHPLAFENIQYFDILELSHNRLRMLSSDLFNTAVLVKQLELDYNAVTIRREHIRGLRKVEIISFMGNNDVSCEFVDAFKRANKTITVTKCNPNKENYY